MLGLIIAVIAASFIVYSGLSELANAIDRLSAAVRDARQQETK